MKHICLLLFFSTTVLGSTFEKIKKEVYAKSILGNPIFFGDFLKSQAKMASIYKLPRCTSKECAFDFSTNSIAAGGNELFTCSPPLGLKINFANNDKGYLFIETSPKEKCSLRLEMKNKDQLTVSQISCPQEKIGDCDKEHLLGDFKRLGRPGFDCGVLTPYLELSEARKTICLNLELSEIDQELDSLYEKVKDKDELRKAETKFMRERESCGANEKCHRGLYLKWRATIKNLESL